ncbi:Rho termination factor N-terminal domain-containing protein, partial [Staphylococcus aureus]
DEFFVSNLFLSYINSEVLDTTYGEFEALDTIDHMHLNDEVFRVRQHTRLNDVTLEHALLLKTNDELKTICRQYGIKGFSNKNKQNLVELIMTAFFNNNHIIEQVFSNATLFEFDI